MYNFFKNKTLNIDFKRKLQYNERRKESLSKRYSKKSMQNDIYKAKNDLVFKFVFSDDMILKDFLQAVLKE